MLKLFLLLLMSAGTGYCFSQSPQNNDSTLKISDTSTVSKSTAAISVNSTTLKVYPNPAKNKITLDVAGFEPGMVVVKIIDTKGKIWRADNRLLTNGTEEITMFLLLQPGIYFISISEKSKVVKKKLIIL
jgi:hypothetical protein